LSIKGFTIGFDTFGYSAKGLLQRESQHQYWDGFKERTAVLDGNFQIGGSLEFDPLQAKALSKITKYVKNARAAKFIYKQFRKTFFSATVSWDGDFTIAYKNTEAFGAIAQFRQVRFTIKSFLSFLNFEITKPQNGIVFLAMGSRPETADGQCEARGVFFQYQEVGWDLSSIDVIGLREVAKIFPKPEASTTYA
jgi:hypothetical protein